MKRLHCGGLLLLVALFATIPATIPALAADQARSLYKQGREAEARQQYEEAYRDFKKAYDLHPENTDFRSAFVRTRLLAAAAHVHRGQELREDGKLSAALKEFQTAAM